MAVTNSLSITHPEVAAQWHPTLNGDLTPYDFTAGSGKCCFWKCSKASDHIWPASINERTKYGCPCCSGKKVVPSNCLATTHPILVAQWHPILNGNITPHNITAGSGKACFWKCSKASDHVWKASPNSRTNMKSGCPCCSRKKAVTSNCLATTHPEVAAQWHPTLNGQVKPNEILSGDNDLFYWKCPKADDHEWRASPSNRTSSEATGCPCCDGKTRSKMKNTKIDIGRIDLSLLKTDEDIRNEAKKRLDHVLIGIGKTSGKVMWAAIKKNGIFKPEPDNQTLFVRNAGQEYKKKATLRERKKTEEAIFQTIKEMKEKFEANGL
jgi:hypothetical protein